MKKIFTLISVALMAIGANAQTEKYDAAIDGGLAPEFQNAELVGTDLIANINGTYVTVKAVASKRPERSYAENPEASCPEPTYSDAAWNYKNKGLTLVKGTDGAEDAVLLFEYLEGTGVPYMTMEYKQVMSDGDPTANWDPAYTLFDPSNVSAFPVSGEYVDFTPNTDGMFRIKFWANKGGSRKLYLVDKTDLKTLDPATEYKVEGYVQGSTRADGSWIFYPSLEINDYLIGGTNVDLGWQDDEGKDKFTDQVGRPKFGWFVFDGKANHTYAIFGSDWQFGFGGYEFTPGAKIADYTPVDPAVIVGISNVTADAAVSNAIYNLAGQKVGADYKGIAIKNGKKVVLK